MALPVTYRTGGEGAVASYDYTDVAEGTGTIIFKGFRADASGAVASYALSTSDIYSTEVASNSGRFTGDSGVFALLRTLNFDLTAFNLPKTIKGTATIEGTKGIKVSGATGEGAVHIIFKVIHYDGTTETTIGTGTTNDLTHSAGNWRVKSFTIQIPLTTKQFKRGDVLRLKAEMYGKLGTADPSDGWFVLAHDPQNRDYASGATIITAASSHTLLRASIPFKLDL